MSTYGSLFSGAGGADIGMERAGFKPLWHCEIDRQCNDVRRIHWPGVPCVEDVRDDFHFLILPTPDVIWLSPPCQDLSVAGKRAGLSGSRSGLFYDAITILGSFVRRGTRYAIMEQVPGLLSSGGGSDFREVVQAFLSIGARDVCWTVLDSQWFGVAQRRRRVYIVVDFGGERASEVLFEPEGMCGDSPPSREAGKVAPSIPSSGAGTSRTGDERTGMRTLSRRNA